ncbi:MAG: hypothetical protein QXN71_01605 [Candidatus Aenigmatarchaeota archaeon]
MEVGEADFSVNVDLYGSHKAKIMKREEKVRKELVLKEAKG